MEDAKLLTSRSASSFECADRASCESMRPPLIRRFRRAARLGHFFWRSQSRIGDCNDVPRPLGGSSLHGLCRRGDPGSILPSTPGPLVAIARCAALMPAAMRRSISSRTSAGSMVPTIRKAHSPERCWSGCRCRSNRNEC